MMWTGLETLTTVHSRSLNLRCRDSSSASASLTVWVMPARTPQAMLKSPALRTANRRSTQRSTWWWLWECVRMQAKLSKMLSTSLATPKWKSRQATTPTTWFPSSTAPTVTHASQKSAVMTRAKKLVMSAIMPWTTHSLAACSSSDSFDPWQTDDWRDNQRNLIMRCG